MHSTNYQNTLILPAADCKATQAEVPTKPDSIAGLQYDALNAAPYALSSDDLLIKVQTTRQCIANSEVAAFRESYFAKGQACLRAAPLVKTHGWAIHHNADSLVALIDPASADFHGLFGNPDITKLPGMRNTRA